MGPSVGGRATRALGNTRRIIPLSNLIQFHNLAGFIETDNERAKEVRPP